MNTTNKEQNNSGKKQGGNDQEQPDPVKYFSDDEPDMLEAIDNFMSEANDDPKEKPVEKEQVKKEVDKEDGPDKEKDKEELDVKESDKEKANKEPDDSKDSTEENKDDDDLPDISPGGMFGDGEDQEEEPEKKSGDEFNEENFDTETDRIIKSLEEKGHPGDVYKQLRNELKELKKKEVDVKIPEDVQKEINELKLKAEEAEGLRERLEEVSMVSAKVKVENSPEYRKEVLEPANGILKSSKELAESYGVDQGKLNQLISETDRQTRNKLIEDVLEDFSEMDRQDVYSMIRKYQDIQSKRDHMLEEADKIIASKEESQKLEQKERTEEYRNTTRKIQNNLWEKYQSVVPGLVDDIGQSTESFSQLKRKAMSIDMSKATPKDEAFAALSGVLLPHVVKELHKANRKLSEYESEDERSVRKSPKVTPGTNNNAPSKDEDDDLMSAINKRF